MGNAAHTARGASAQVETGDYWVEPASIEGNTARAYAPDANTLYCPIRFQGQWEDGETELYYNRFRYYDMITAHYLSRDPIGFHGGTLQTLYAGQPNIFVDPLGLVPLSDPGWNLYHVVKRVNGRNVVCYVGITRDITRRRQDHMNSGLLGPGLDLIADTSVSNVDYATARGAEQADIEFFGTRSTEYRGRPVNSGDPNRINSFDPSRTDERGQAFNRGRAARSQGRCCATGLADFVGRTDDC